MGSPSQPHPTSHILVLELGRICILFAKKRGGREGEGEGGEGKGKGEATADVATQNLLH